MNSHDHPKNFGKVYGVITEKISREKANVLFDIDNNRIFTISDLAKDILNKRNEKINISEIIEFIREKYHLSGNDAELKCKGFINGLIEKRIMFLK